MTRGKGNRQHTRKSSFSHSMKAGTRRIYRRIMQCLLILLCIITAACGGKAVINSCSNEKPKRQTVNSREFNGIDVSKHNGDIDWQKVASDKRIQFVYIKATEGASGTDAMYQRNINQARGEGIKVGSYHYFISWRTAKEQFANFRKHVKPSEQDLIPMVDVELRGCSKASRADLQKNLSEFMRLVKKEYGSYPILYSQYRFYNERLAPEFNKYYIFIARYGSNLPTLKGGGKYNIWQFTENGRIKGIRNAVDLDRFENGTALSDIEAH